MIWLYDRGFQKTQTTMNADGSVTFSQPPGTACYPAPEPVGNKLQRKEKRTSFTCKAIFRAKSSRPQVICSNFFFERHSLFSSVV